MTMVGPPGLAWMRLPFRKCVALVIVTTITAIYPQSLVT